jgi:galactokinase
VSIVKEAAIEKFVEEVGSAYIARTGLIPAFYVSEAGQGGHEIQEKA